MRQSHDNVDVPSKFSYLETGSLRLEQNEEDDYEDNDMNEYDQMNDEFKDVDEVMGDRTKNGASTSQIKTVKLNGQTPSNLSGYKKRRIELDLGNDVTSQGTTI
jgi:hypothetical protein